MNLPVYMDYHATTPCDPRVLEAMIPWFTRQFGNAASKGHFFGWQAAEAVEIAREQVAGLLHCDPQEVVFTSGATESVNLAIKGSFEMLSHKGKHIVTVSTEHPAVLDTCRHLEKSGAEISFLPVDSDGLIELEQLKAAIRTDTILIAVMMANNETGVIQSLKDISEIARSKGILFFTDASQALGKLPIDVTKEGVDLLACSAHKIYGPKGIGALYVRRRNPKVRLVAQQDGGGHERGLRSGTLNVPGIVGFGQAAALAELEMAANMNAVGRLRDRLEEGILSLGNAAVNGSKSKRLKTVTNIRFGQSEGRRLISGLLKDIAVSSGSACSSASVEPSHVLKAMGLEDGPASDSIRFSLGKFNTQEEVDYVIERLALALKESVEFFAVK